LNVSAGFIKNIPHAQAGYFHVIEKLACKQAVKPGTVIRRRTRAGGAHDNTAGRGLYSRKPPVSRTRPSEGVVPAGVQNDYVKLVSRAGHFVQYILNGKRSLTQIVFTFNIRGVHRY